MNNIGPWCGTLNGYRHRHCRCDACKVANSEYQRASTARRRGQATNHGKATTYVNYGCRCDQCRAAWAEYVRDYRRRRKESA
jgi:hypothetical protein